MVCIISQAVFLLYFLVSLGLANKCIENYDNLEKSINSNPENVYNLTKGFYPVNKVSPLWINVNYNINNSHTERNTTTQQHNVYTFLWTSSPVLILTPPDFLELWSLQSITFETRSSIDIVILPFCNNVDEDTKLNLLNYATIWVSDLLFVHSMFNSFKAQVIH